MARYAYDRLSALDNSFLALERLDAYMHVASTQIFEAGPLSTASGGIDAGAIKEMVESCLHLIPRYRQKLAWIPFQNHPVWVDDAQFKLDYHVRHTSLPRPGDDEQLKRLSARIMEQHLDRRRPLWEMWVVEGLEHNRFALISKVHHCMIDGVSGVDLMKVLMTTTTDYEIHESPTYIPRPAPSGMELLTHEVMRQATLPLSILPGVGSLLTEFRDIRRQALTGARTIIDTLGGSLRPPSSTPINGSVGPHRLFDWLTMELSDIKAIRKTLGGSLNDVVLAVVTGATRRFLERRRVSPAEIEFRVLAPVSVRGAKEQGAMGNRVSAWVVELPVGEEDPVRQLEAISKRTAELKQAKGAVSAELLTQAAEWTPSMLLSLAGRNVTRLLPFNMVVTNVPGPQCPMYMLGAEMLEVFPHVPLFERLGLGIALMSYNGKLCWGFNADYELVPDVAAFLGCVREAFEDLRRLAAVKRSTLEQMPVQAARAAAAGNGGSDQPETPQKAPGPNGAGATAH